MKIVGVFTVYLIAVILLFFLAPHNGEFWWSDSPRHALNGVLIKDMAVAFPWRDPAGFAMQYYIQYPALTVLFYPPLFYIVLAPLYALFGVSHATALAVVLAYYLTFAFGMYFLARRWLGPWLALAVGISAMCAPGIALWGRQVMLEVPALACATWGLLLLRRHAESERPALLYPGSFILLCAVYTKISAIFLIPVAALMLLAARGNTIWRDRHVWMAAILFLVGLVPVTVLTLKFGQANMASMVGIPDAVVSRYSLAGWFWYARQLPGQLGWAVLAAAILWPVLALAGRRPRDFDRADLVLLLGWFLTGYIFFCLIDLKEARHSTLILPPLIFAAFLAIDGLSPARWAIPLGLLLVGVTGFYTWRYEPVPQVAGYREAAEWIAREAPRDAVILFSGYRDGSFVFNLRSFETRRNPYTVRADKLLLDVAVRRELGVRQRPLDEAEIGTMLDQIGVYYAVAQSDFWTDLDVMARLQSVLRSDHFEEVARIPVVANVGTEDKELRIYRNRHQVNVNGTTLKLNLPIIGRSLEGRIGGHH